jgi:hypothetical protein
MNIYEEGTSTTKNVLKEKPIQGMNILNVRRRISYRCRYKGENKKKQIPVG